MTTVKLFAEEWMISLGWRVMMDAHHFLHVHRQLNVIVGKLVRGYMEETNDRAKVYQAFRRRMEGIFGE